MSSCGRRHKVEPSSSRTGSDSGVGATSAATAWASSLKHSFTQASSSQARALANPPVTLERSRADNSLGPRRKASALPLRASTTTAASVGWGKAAARSDSRASRADTSAAAERPFGFLAQRGQSLQGQEPAHQCRPASRGAGARRTGCKQPLRPQNYMWVSNVPPDHPALLQDEKFVALGRKLALLVEQAHLSLNPSAGSRRRLRTVRCPRKAADPVYPVAAAVRRRTQRNLADHPPAYAGGYPLLRRLTSAATDFVHTRSRRRKAADPVYPRLKPPAYAGGYQLYPWVPVAAAVRISADPAQSGRSIRRLTPAATHCSADSPRRLPISSIPVAAAVRRRSQRNLADHPPAYAGGYPLLRRLASAATDFVHTRSRRRKAADPVYPRLKPPAYAGGYRFSPGAPSAKPSRRSSPQLIGLNSSAAALRARRSP
jgi:hypothetical protein